MEKIEKALNIARESLADKYRLSGEDYFSHVKNIQNSLKYIGIKEQTTQIATLLHRTLDFNKKYEEIIKKEFGQDTFNVLQNHTRIKSIKVEKDSPLSSNEAYLTQLYINVAEDIRSLVIRLINKADNLETCFIFDSERRNYIGNRALYLYSPVSRLIGLTRLAAKIEDNAFKVLNPADYYKIEMEINKNMHLWEPELVELKSFLEEILKEKGIPNKISSRIKHKYGIYKKRSRPNTPVRDIVGVRIIVDSIENCYVVENILREIWSTEPKLHNDYIQHPRSSGYKSLHNTIRFSNHLEAEVQIRTHDMHEFNEFGQAAHLLYKIGDKGEKSLAYSKFKDYMKENPSLFKDLQKWDIESNTENSSVIDTFKKYVYVFTPKGDIVELPRDSTIIDFAYSLHSDIGEKCSAGFVNNKLVTLDYKVKDGDCIRIKTSNNVNANLDWLRIVKTKRAKSELKKLFNNIS
ncbi:MAG: GTP pyrophosphokinase [uncultured bacterium]|nr:MAG: GTP pyrophosphokinase [uncultured bacterium]